MSTAITIERKTGAAARSARRCIEKYSEDASQLASRLGANNLSGRYQLCWELQEGGV